MEKRNRHVSSATPCLLHAPVLSCDLPVCSPSCITAKHLLFETQMSGALLPPKPNQWARLCYHISRAALQCCGSVFSLVKSLFHRGFKTDFIKCSISKWATHPSWKVMSTPATRAELQNLIQPWSETQVCGWQNSNSSIDWLDQLCFKVTDFKDSFQYSRSWIISGTLSLSLP